MVWTTSAFCFGETALDVEGVLKQAILKRGIPRKLIIDNGSGVFQDSCRLKQKKNVLLAA
jgi:hypothetical protein